MKKIIISILAVIMLATGVFAMVACNKAEETTSIVSISGVLNEDVELTVGDEYSADDFILTAVLSDEKEVVVTNASALTYDKSGISLDSKGCYAKAGKQTIVITYLSRPVTIEFTVAEVE